MDKLGNRVYLTLPAEDEDGSVEYKWCLVNSNSSRSEEFAREKIRAEPEFPNVYKRNKLSSQMRWRLGESPSKKRYMSLAFTTMDS